MCASSADSLRPGHSPYTHMGNVQCTTSNRALLEASLHKKAKSHSPDADHPPEAVRCFVPRIDTDLIPPPTGEARAARRPEAGVGAATAGATPVRQARVKGWTLNPDWKPHATALQR